MSQSNLISKKRIVLLLLITLILVTSLVLRVIYLQVFEAGWLSQLAEKQRFRALPVLPRRGTIYDRLGNELAISIDADCIYAVPKEIGIEVTARTQNGKKTQLIKGDSIQRNKIANLIGGVLSLDPGSIERKLNQQASFIWIKRKATYNEVEKLRKLIKSEKIHGIEISQSPQRFYPEGSLAAQLIGIAGIDNQGLEGLEKGLDVYLRGLPGSDRAEFDTQGRHIPQGERRYLPPVPGDSVYLTIDQNIQYITERELDKAVAATKSKRGMAIVIDPQTGEILALANNPKFDPNHFADFPAANRRNPIFSDMYEPGSTFKVFTSSAALEEGKVTLESRFFDPGFLIVKDRRIKCWKAGGHGSQNFVEALENSCNPVFATLAMQLTKETLYKYIRAFGFETFTGIDFPGETAGRLKPLREVNDVELANIGFGQGITVTPIQMVMGVAAIANGGYLLKPHLVKEIYSVDGKLKKRFERQVRCRAISAKTANLMAKLMQSVVTNGSGNQAFLEGYRVAGKTGTAEKVKQGVRGYSERIASFVGFAPADNPKLLAMVILDEPGAPIKYGGVIAAPVVGNIFRDSLRYIGIKPQYEPETVEKLAQDEVLVPNILNMTVAEATRQLMKEQINYRTIGQGEVVLNQIPKPGVKVKRNTAVLIYLDTESHFNTKTSKVVLPNFQGFPLEKVAQVLKELGLKLEAKGSGVAVGQTPLPGMALDKGSVVKVNFKPSAVPLP